MEEKTYRLQSMDLLTVPGPAADKLLALGDGECALLYLYILRSGGSYSVSAAARALGREESAVRAASDKLGRIGLLTESRMTPLPPAEEPHSYTAEDILERSRVDGTFRALQAECSVVMGKTLSRVDLETLFDIYDHLGMSPDTIMLLIHHCADRLRKKYGENRLPTMHYIQQQAYAWAKKEILTAPQAEEYLAWLDRLASEEAKLRDALQITGREPTRTERSYMEQWLSMGFSAEVLALAYDRTMTQTGRMAWPYMNKIVLSWYEKKLFTLTDIEKGDQRQSGRRKKPVSAPGADGQEIHDDLAYLESTLTRR